LPEVVAFANIHQMPVLTIEDIINYRQRLISAAAE
jgi:3,4-dihydroxy-2-butanone 4-phosphate synthase